MTIFASGEVSAAPSLEQVVAVTNPTSDSTPNYTFSSTQAGTISYAGSCASATTAAAVGNNTITLHIYNASINRDCANDFNVLPPGTYSDCVIRVTNVSGATSAPLTINTFTVTGSDTSPPLLAFTDNVAQGPVVSDTVTVSWADATVKKWMYSANAVCGSDAAAYPYTDANSMTQTAQTNNGSYICVYAEDAIGHRMTMVSAYPIAIDPNATPPDTTPPAIVFTDNVDPGPVISDTVTVSWADATVKKWMYSPTRTCSVDAAAYPYTDANSMTQTAQTNNGLYICVYATDSVGNFTTLASAYAINIGIAAPMVTQVTPVETPSANTTPSFTVHTTQAGLITYSGGCSSTTTVAIAGDNTITFSALVPGTYDACKIVVTNEGDAASTPLTVNAFTITGESPSSPIGSAGTHNTSIAVQSMLTMSCTPTTVNFGMMNPGTPQTAQGSCTVTTNATNGYTLSVQRVDVTATMALSTNAAISIPDRVAWDNNVPNATVWQTGDAHLGFTVISSTANKNTTWWGNGTTAADHNNLYAGFPLYAKPIMSTAQYHDTATETVIGYKVDVTSAQSSGLYQGTVTYQATINP